MPLNNDRRVYERFGVVEAIRRLVQRMDPSREKRAWILDDMPAVSARLTHPLPPFLFSIASNGSRCMFLNVMESPNRSTLIRLQAESLSFAMDLITRYCT
jgi:hypothetical protein